MSSGRKRSRRDTDSYYYYDGEEEKDGGLERGQGERWTHFGGGDIGDDDSKSSRSSSRSSGSLASFAATYEYPLSRYLEPALLEEDGGELRMVLYRINASCVVAPFLEFALASDGDWPHVEEEEEGTTTGSDVGGGEQEEEEEEVRGRLAAATNAAYVLSGAAAENGHFPPRFCGASTFDAAAPDGGRRQYAWFQIDPSVTASASLVWATVHELVRVRAIRGAALAAETASFDPRVWHLLDVRGEPVETPMVLEPLTFIGDDGSGSSSSARADGEDEADWVQRMMDREADPANYSPRNDAPEHSDHRLVGRTMFSFHDPHWPAFLEAASRGSGKNGNGSGGSTDSTDVERRRRYAVFLEDTLYLVGDCARENAAMLDFADSHGLFGSVYLRCTAASTSDGAANAMGAAVGGAAVDDVAAVDVAAAPATTAFIWLIQSTDQFAPLE